MSIHTLACSALKIAHDVSKSLGKPSSILIDKLNERDPALAKQAMEPQNFFKHARKDPNAVLPFDPGMTPYHIYDALVTYEGIYNEISRHMELFRFYFRLHYPKVFSGAAEITAPEGFDIDVLRRASRPDFFRQLAPLFKS